ncbi:MAG: AMP-binding protein [Bacteroidales bacterium]|nr:AMP-binding protein [Bacteroidales bacterium]
MTSIHSETMVEVFEENSGKFPAKVIYYYLEDGLNESSRITYREMNARVKAIAAVLQDQYEKGARALLLFPTGIEFIVSLFGCFYSGIIGVPAYPPRKNRLFGRFEAIVNDCRPSLILTTRKIKEDILKNFAGETCLKGVDFVAYEDVDAGMESRWKNPGLCADDLALLQYTSGSTGAPNGVMVSHGNILRNSETIKESFGHDENLMGVNWLPAFHDMGLIGALIQPAYVGGSNAIIPPNSFLLRPLNWLKAISRYRGNTVGGPNFALDYCVERFKPEELDGTDLSCVRPFFCGAEPVRSESLESFSETFKPYHFRSDQFYPCYGLAESVLIVTGGGLFDDPVYLSVDTREIEKGRVVLLPGDSPDAKTFVSCGYPWQGTTVKIVHPESCIVNPPGEVGEIWVSGPSVARGYWNKPEETERTFGARLADTGEGPFLRTGDLGFIHKGHLYITGRIKDLIIIRGLNHYPHDIEQTAAKAHEALQSGSVAAFSVDEAGEERLVLVCEIRRTHLRDLDANAVFEALRQAITDTHQIQVHAIALIRTNTLPKTSSGKIQRLTAKKEYLGHELELLDSWKAEHPSITTHHSALSTQNSTLSTQQIEFWLIAWLSKELKIPAESIDITKPVTAYGLDSLKAVALARDAEEHFGIEWPLEWFLEETTVKALITNGKELLDKFDG